MYASPLDNRVQQVDQAINVTRKLVTDLRMVHRPSKSTQAAVVSWLAA
jgi:hypothetical protein